MIKNLKFYLLKSYFLALVLSFIVIIFLPNIFDKYKIEVVDQGIVETSENLKVYCNDMDNDGFSEKIYSYEYKGNHSLQVITHDGGIIDQWNPDGIIAGQEERLVCGDYDKDGFDEVYTFYQRNDTVFLYCFEPTDTLSQIYFDNKMVCKLSHQYSEPEYFIINILFQDINGDGNGDLFFVINSGRSKFPRNIFIYDIFKDTLIISEDYGSTFNFDVNLWDIDNDGKMEICGDMTAAGQVSDTLGYDYSDYSIWLMVFNHKLEFLFEPIEFPGFRGRLFVIPVSINGTKLFAGFYNHLGRLDNYPKLFLVNKKGEIVKDYKFPKSNKVERWLNVKEKNGKLFFNIIDENGIINVFDQSLEFLKKLDIKYSVSVDCKNVDLDMDGQEEFIFSTKNHDILITRNDFSNPVLFSTNSFFGYPLSIIQNGNNKPYLYLNIGKDYLCLQYSKNPLAVLRFLIYLGIFVGFWLFILLIRKLQLIQTQKKEEIRNQIVNLQLKGFCNQMDPHFTFNVFNTVAYRIQKESPDIYNAFMQFSNLIRKTLESSDSITRTINDELSHLKSYLELEKLRYSEKLQYTISVDKQINLKMHIPKMILQTYVENAIKHGIRHKEKSGLVSINISKQKRNIVFDITDDGIGREKAKEVSKNSTGFGLKIMDNYFNLFNEYNETKIKYEIIDLFDKQNLPTGTKVNILIPLNFSYKLKKHGKG